MYISNSLLPIKYLTNAEEVKKIGISNSINRYPQCETHSQGKLRAFSVADCSMDASTLVGLTYKFLYM